MDSDLKKHLKNSYVIIKERGNVLKFGNGYTMTYALKDALEDVMEGDSIKPCSDLPLCEIRDVLTTWQKFGLIK